MCVCVCVCVQILWSEERDGWIILLAEKEFRYNIKADLNTNTSHKKRRSCWIIKRLQRRLHKLDMKTTM